MATVVTTCGRCRGPIERRPTAVAGWGHLTETIDTADGHWPAPATARIVCDCGKTVPAKLTADGLKMSAHARPADADIHPFQTCIERLTVPLDRVVYADSPRNVGELIDQAGGIRIEKLPADAIATTAVSHLPAEAHLTPVEPPREQLVAALELAWIPLAGLYGGVAREQLDDELDLAAVDALHAVGIALGKPYCSPPAPGPAEITSYP